MAWVAFDVRPSNEPLVHRMIMSATVIYMLAAAIPFVPGAEIGFALILAFGTPIVVLVYASMVAALTLSYVLGRFVPARTTAALFDFLGFGRARRLVLDMAPLGASERLELLTAHASRRIVPVLLRRRFLAFAVMLNLPGNTLF